MIGEDGEGPKDFFAFPMIFEGQVALMSFIAFIAFMAFGAFIAWDRNG